MEATHDIPDSTDWLQTPLFGLATLENALHCQICKEFYDTPMITSCSHTFCSKCIRIALSTDGQCPACRTKDQASKLRNNWQLQEVVSAFLASRPTTLELARAQQSALEVAAKRPAKRKRMSAAIDDTAQKQNGGRTTRSKSRKIAGSQASQTGSVDVEDSEDDSVFVPEPEQPDDGLVECPLGCGKRMKIEQVDPHLDRCADEQEAATQAQSQAPSLNRRATSREQSRPQDRLVELNYSMVKERDLAKKLKDLGVPNWGSKQLMTKRHTVWVNIWNANCDSNHPRAKRDLLRELDVWERTQGGSAPNVTSSIMRKDFDGDGWGRKNQDEFTKLITNARQSRTNAVDKSKDESSTTEVDSTPAPLASDAIPPNQSIPLGNDPNPIRASDLRRQHDQNPASSTTAATTLQPNDDARPAIQLDPTSNGQNATLTMQSRASHDAEDQTERTKGRDQHTDGDPKAPCELPAHLATDKVRKMPMFAMQSAPVEDICGPVERGG